MTKDQSTQKQLKKKNYKTWAYFSLSRSLDDPRNTFIIDCLSTSNDSNCGARKKKKEILKHTLPFVFQAFKLFFLVECLRRQWRTADKQWLNFKRLLTLGKRNALGIFFHTKRYEFWGPRLRKMHGKYEV